MQQQGLREMEQRGQWTEAGCVRVWGGKMVRIESNSASSILEDRESGPLDRRVQRIQTDQLVAVEPNGELHAVGDH